MSLQKRHRYTRKTDGTPIRFNASPRYLLILEYLAKYKWMNIHHFSALLWLAQKQGDLALGEHLWKSIQSVNTKGIQANLNKLWHNHYINRLIHRSKNYTLGSHKDPYFLAPQGALKLAQEKGLFPDDIHYPKPPDKGKPHGGDPEGEYAGLLHKLSVSESRIILRMAFAMHPGARYVFSCGDQEIIEEIVVNQAGHQLVHTIMPDAWVVIESKNGERLNLFIEMDRSTESKKYFKKKIQAYQALRKQNQGQLTHTLFQSLYNQWPEELFHETITPKPSWFDKFFVLTFTTQSEQRAYNLAKLTQTELGQEGGYFFYAPLQPFQYCQRVEKTSQKGKKYSQYKMSFHMVKKIFAPLWYSGDSRHKDQLVKLF